jgi:hypothetical protein
MEVNRTMDAEILETDVEVLQTSDDLRALSSRVGIA